MFTQADWKENQRNRVEIVDIEPEVFKTMLDFVYTGKSKAVDQLAFGLIRAANKVSGWVYCLFFTLLSLTLSFTVRHTQTGRTMRKQAAIVAHN
jgi:hypothetical protein